MQDIRCSAIGIQAVYRDIFLRAACLRTVTAPGMESLVPAGWAGGFGEALALLEVLGLVAAGAVVADDLLAGGKYFSIDT